MHTSIESKIRNELTLTNISRVGVLLTALFPVTFGEARAFAQELPTPAVSTLNNHESAPLKVTGVKDLITRWQPDRNLYVEGECGVSEENLSRLAAWLREEHPNWTVYLAQNSKNERYTDAGGAHHKGEQALQYCLGHELPNRTRFSDLIDANTKEPNGAILYITFDTRRVGYFAGSAYDSRNIGENSWSGNLDSFAIEKLKQRQVVAAVMAPIKEIDERLDGFVTRERSEREIGKNVAAEDLREIEKTSQRIKEVITKFHESHPSLVGTLFEKPLHAVNENMELARASYSQGSFKNLKEHSRRIELVLSEVSNTISEFEGGPGKIAALRNELSELKKSELSSDLAKELMRVEELLEKVAHAHALGAPSFSTSLTEAERELEGIHSSIRWAQSKEIAFASLIDLLAVASTLIGAYALYRQRAHRTSKEEEAKTLLSEREKALDEKIYTLFSLDEMQRKYIGHSVGLENLRGESKQVAEEVISEIGQMFILGSSAREVVKRVREVLSPNTAWQSFQAALAKGHFEEAIQMLKTKPIVFEEGSALETSIKGKAEGDWLKLYGELHEYAPFSVTFDELLNKFNTKGRAVEKTLNNIRDRSEQIPVLFEEGSVLLKNIKESTRFEIAGFTLSLAPQLTVAAERLYTTLERAVAGGLFDPLAAHKEGTLLLMRMRYLHSLCLAVEKVSLSKSTLELKDFLLGPETSSTEKVWIEREVASLADVIEKSLMRAGSAPAHELELHETEREIENYLSSVLKKTQMSRAGKEDLSRIQSTIKSSLTELEGIGTAYSLRYEGDRKEALLPHASTIKEKLREFLLRSEELTKLFEGGNVIEGSIRTSEYSKEVSQCVTEVVTLKKDFSQAAEALSLALQALTITTDSREPSLPKKVKSIARRWGEETLTIPVELQNTFAGVVTMNELLTHITTTRSRIIKTADDCIQAFEKANFKGAVTDAVIIEKLSENLSTLLNAPHAYEKHLEELERGAVDSVREATKRISDMEKKIHTFKFSKPSIERAKEAIVRCKELLHSTSSIRSPFMKQKHLKDFNEIYVATDLLLQQEIETSLRDEAERAHQVARKAAARKSSSSRSSNSSAGTYGGSSSSSSSYDSSSGYSSGGYSSGFSSSNFDGGGSSGFSSSGW